MGVLDIIEELLLEHVVSRAHTPYLLVRVWFLSPKYLPTDAAHENVWVSSQAGPGYPAKVTPALTTLAASHLP
jgi:hypothetical protein